MHEDGQIMQISSRKFCSNEQVMARGKYHETMMSEPINTFSMSSFDYSSVRKMPDL